VLDDEEKRLTAYHEAGHAIVLALVGEAEPVHKVTIIPRGQALGVTMQLPEKDVYTQGKRKLVSMLVGLMGGRAAEELACKDITTGAQNDLKQATRIARMMICEWGMSSELGPQSFGNREEFMFHGREVTRSNDISEDTARKIDGEVTKMLNEAYERALQILRDNRDKLETMTRLLLERESIDGREVLEIVRHGRILSDNERQPPEATSGGTPPPATPAPIAAATQPASPPSMIVPPSPRPTPA
jgi:cell division protease FtsH